MPAGAGSVQREGASRAAAAAVLVAVGLVAIHLVGVRAFAHEPLRSAFPEGALPLWAELLSAVSLSLAVASAWLCRGSRRAVAVGLAVAVGGATLPVWASWTEAPSALRSVALTGGTFMAAGLAVVATAWSTSRPRLQTASYGLAAVALAVQLLAYDPVSDPWCSRTCRSVAAPAASVVTAERTVTAVGLLTLAVVVIGLIGTAVGRGPVTVRVGVSWSLLVVAAGSVGELAMRDSATWARTTSMWLPWALAPSAVSVLLSAARGARTRRAVDALLHDLEEGRGVGAQFAVPGEDRWVDAAGLDLPPSPTGLVLYDDDGPAVRLATAPDLPHPNDLSPARRLALANARLTALSAAQLREVQAAQRRTVARADVERHRIERDLHDGAQQVLVSAAFHLGVASARGETGPGHTVAQERVACALERLRDIAHGPVPAVLAEEGLRVSLEELAAETGTATTLVVRGEREPPYDLAMTVYVCAAALSDAASPAPCRLEVDVAEHAVRLTASSPADLHSGLTVALMDRVGALAGSVRELDEQGRTVEVHLPCAW